VGLQSYCPKTPPLSISRHSFFNYCYYSIFYYSKLIKNRNMNKNNIQAAAFFMLISVTGFSIMDLSVKWTTASYPIGEVIFFRMIFGIIPLIFVVPKERWKNLFETKKTRIALYQMFNWYLCSFRCLCIFTLSTLGTNSIPNLRLPQSFQLFYL